MRWDEVLGGEVNKMVGGVVKWFEMLWGARVGVQ